MKYYLRNIFSEQNASIIILIIFSLFATSIQAQPYLDLININNNYSPKDWINTSTKQPIAINHFTASSNLPLQLKNKKDLIIISPFFENWYLTNSSSSNETYSSITFPLTFVKTLPNEKWGISVTGIIRWNDSCIDKQSTIQLGTALITRYKADKDLILKLGFYLNDDLFGIFFMPLVGLEWKINSKTLLFGNLPGSLRLEYKKSNSVYLGAVFRAITNSYGMNSGYWRVDENQLGVYSDIQLSNKFVLNTEIGHSVFRKLRKGIFDNKNINENAADNFYGALTIAYRIRFDNK